MTQNYASFMNEGMEKMMNPENLTKCFSSTLDMSKVQETMKETTETVQKIAQVAVESAQAMMTRTNQMAQDTAKNLTKSVKEVASAKDPNEAIALQRRLVQDSVSEAFSNANEVLNMLSKSTMELFKMMSDQAAETCSMPSNVAKAASKK